MTEIILKMILLDVIWVLMWKIATEPNMIFEKIGDFGRRKVDEGYMIFDGLITCPYCLGNIHGILFVWPLAFLLNIVPFEWEWKYLLCHIFVAGGTSIIAGFVWSGYKHFETKSRYYEHLEQQEYFRLKEKKKAYQNAK